MDTFTPTAYNAATDVVTFNATLDGTTYTGLKVSGCPKENVDDVKAFFKKYVEAYAQGKAQETAKVSGFAPEVAALLNKATPFV